MDLTNTHLRYLQAIYQLSQGRPEVRSAAVAGALGVTRPSVAKMLDVLAEKELVTRERYGKIALTEQGAALAQQQIRYVRLLARRLSALGLDLTDREAEEAACALAAALPRRCRERL